MNVTDIGVSAAIMPAAAASWTGNVLLSYTVVGGTGSLTFTPAGGTTDLLQQLKAQLPPTFDFYVSSTTGNDANDGLTPASAKRTIAAASALLGPGKSLGIEYGSYFREQLSIAAPNVRVGAYGVGERPILDASDEVPTASITKTPGQAHVYQFDVTPLANPTGHSFPFSTFENGQRLKRTASLAECESTEGSFWPDTARVYFHAISSADPLTSGRSYEVAVRDAGIDSADTATGLQLANVHAKRGQLNDGVLRVNGRGSVLTACIAEDGTKHTLYVTDNCLLEDVICWKGEGYDSYFVYYYQNNNNDSVGTTFRRCIAIGGFAYGAEESGYNTASGYYCHSLASTHLASVTYESCYAENLTAGFGSDALLSTVRNCRTHLVATSVYGSSYTGQVVNVQGGFFDQRDGQPYQKTNNQQRVLLRAETGTTNFERNVLLVSPTNYAFLLYSSSPDSIINFNNNTVLVENNGSCGALCKSGTGLLSFARNIFYGVTDVVTCYGAATQVASSSNVYYRPSGGIKWTLNNNTYTTLADWQASGQDANAIEINPAFVVPLRYWRTVGNTTPSAAPVLALGAGAV